MNRTKTLSVSATLLTLVLFAASLPARAQQSSPQIVHIAELEIDPAQLEPYKAALKEEIEASIRIEPGVLTLDASALKDNPTHLRIFEVYANLAAYNAHRETPHFKKYKAVTQNMVKSLRLLELDPILLGSKERLQPIPVTSNRYHATRQGFRLEGFPNR